MPDPVVEFFTEKEWYDQDEISMNKRLAVREFFEWIQSRPTKRAADGLCTCGATPVVGGAEVCLFCGMPKVAHR